MSEVLIEFLLQNNPHLIITIALDQKIAEQFIDSVIFENVEWKKTLSMLTELLESVKKNGY